MLMLQTLKLELQQHACKGTVVDVFRRKSETSPKAQQTQGIEYYDSFNTVSSKQKL